MSKPLHFFLGANTPQGFVSRFDQLADPSAGWREYIIKGGPGTGKSTLMKRVAKAFEPESDRIEWIHCSSDVESLDGVIIHDQKISIADGTPPQENDPFSNKTKKSDKIVDGTYKDRLFSSYCLCYNK